MEDLVTAATLATRAIDIADCIEHLARRPSGACVQPRSRARRRHLRRNLARHGVIDATRSPERQFPAGNRYVPVSQEATIAKDPEPLLQNCAAPSVACSRRTSASSTWFATNSPGPVRAPSRRARSTSFNSRHAASQQYVSGWPADLCAVPQRQPKTNFAGQALRTRVGGFQFRALPLL